MNNFFRSYYNSVFLFLFFLLTAKNLNAQNYKGLTKLDSKIINAYFSEGAKGIAENMAKRCENVIKFYKPLVGFEPEIRLLVLSPSDWPKFTSFPVYGMPHYNDSKTLIVASEDNDFWKSFILPVNQLPESMAKQITEVYSNPDRSLSMRAFFDLLAIHELGHAFHKQARLFMQRKWMGELFSNILLHTYIAEKEPEILPALTLFPEMVVMSTNKNELSYTSLKDLEDNYDKIGQEFPKNYGWYQCRWHKEAGRIYDIGGIESFTKLWYVLKNNTIELNDESFAELLLKSDLKTIANVQLKWEE